MKRAIMIGVMLAMSGIRAWADDLTIDGNLTVTSNLTVQGQVVGINASGITNGILSAAVLPTNGTWNARAMVISNAQFVAVTNFSGENLANGSVTAAKLQQNVVLTNVNADMLDGQHATNFATAEQGAKADSALQSNGNGSLLIGITAAQVGALSATGGVVQGRLDINGPLKGDNAAWGQDLNPTNISFDLDWYAHGQSQHGMLDYDWYQDPNHPFGSMSLGYGGGWHEGAAGASQWGYAEGGKFKITQWSMGAMQRGHVYGSALMYMGPGARGAEQAGLLCYQSTASNSAIAAVQLFSFDNASIPQHALTTPDGAASILLGAGVSSNRNAIVAGDGQASHGNGSITAGGGFYGNGSNLTGITAAQVEGALTQEQADQRYLAAVGGAVSSLAVTNLSVSGTVTLTAEALMYIPPQGDLAMGAFTNGPAQ